MTECQRQYGARYDDEYPPMMVYALPTPLRLDRPLDHAAMRACIRTGLVLVVFSVLLVVSVLVGIALLRRLRRTIVPPAPARI